MQSGAPHSIGSGSHGTMKLNATLVLLCESPYGWQEPGMPTLGTFVNEQSDTYTSTFAYPFSHLAVYAGVEEALLTASEILHV